MHGGREVLSRHDCYLLHGYCCARPLQAGWTGPRNLGPPRLELSPVLLASGLALSVKLFPLSCESFLEVLLGQGSGIPYLQPGRTMSFRGEMPPCALATCSKALFRPHGIAGQHSGSEIPACAGPEPHRQQKLHCVLSAIQAASQAERQRGTSSWEAGASQCAWICHAAAAKAHLWRKASPSLLQLEGLHCGAQEVGIPVPTRLAQLPI